jgi:WS/DGAT/MGAT family acyltransferase
MKQNDNQAPLHQLNDEDAQLLASQALHAHTTLVHIYDPSSAPGGQVRFKAILARIEQRLHLAPIFRQKLLHMPLEIARPYWVDDVEFDVEAHVSHVALPKPGDWRQFNILASRIHARPLDMNRPLWQIHVIEGLDKLEGLPSGCFALLTKVHHAAIDDGDANDLTTLLHDPVARTAKEPPQNPWFPRPTPPAATLFARAHLGWQPLSTPMAWEMRRMLGELSSVSQVMAKVMLNKLMHETVTRFNAVVSARRVFTARRFDLHTFRAIRRLVPGATINDAILAVCGGALRHYLQHHLELPDTGLSALVPHILK